MSSQREFIIGCLVGGFLGASAALVLPNKLLNRVSTRPAKHPKNHASNKNQASSTGGNGHAAPKKRSSRKSVKQT